MVSPKSENISCLLLFCCVCYLLYHVYCYFNYFCKYCVHLEPKFRLSILLTLSMHSRVSHNIFNTVYCPSN